MIDLDQLRRLGDPFCVWHNLSNATLVTPRAFRKDNAVPIGGDQFEDHPRLIVLGLRYCVAADAAGEGFTLSALVPGGTSRDIFTAVTGAAGHIADGGPVYIPLTPASFYSPVAEGASLVLTVVGTPTGGGVLVWGVQTSTTQDREETYSPLTMT